MKRGVLLIVVLLFLVSCSSTKDFGQVNADSTVYASFEGFLQTMEEGTSGSLKILAGNDTLTLLSHGLSSRGEVLELRIDNATSPEFFLFSGMNLICVQEDLSFFSGIGSLQGLAAKETVFSLIDGMLRHAFDPDDTLCYEGTMVEAVRS